MPAQAVCSSRTVIMWHCLMCSRRELWPQWRSPRSNMSSGLVTCHMLLSSVNMVCWVLQTHTYSRQFSDEMCIEIIFFAFLHQSWHFGYKLALPFLWWFWWVSIKYIFLTTIQKCWHFSYFKIFDIFPVDIFHVSKLLIFFLFQKYGYFFLLLKYGYFSNFKIIDIFLISKVWIFFWFQNMDIFLFLSELLLFHFSDSNM